ncbi:MAG: 50S ribosomal protein L31e [Candidatus Thermoplasmatota archaeon]|jgi:large subunit ribosomal protein L31e|nr:50S ribosomal protein L31e [Candidatus Thermoplasmatota archaeon]
MVENEYSSETIMNIPLRGTRNSSRSRRADTAISMIRAYVSKNTRIEETKIWIDSRVNEDIWKRGRENVQSKITVKVIKLQDGTAEVLLP